MPEHVATFYRQYGVFLLQGYGLTESSPVISGETPDHYKTGTVGKILPGVEVKIAPDGEIYLRGRRLLDHLDAAELDRLIGSVYVFTERWFPRVVKLAFTP